MTPRIAKFIAAIGLVAVPLFLVQAASGQGNADWTRPFPAFKLIGNIYWVGGYDLSTYLITTPQGISSSTPASATRPRRSRRVSSSWGSR